MDGNGCLYGTLAGNTREILHKFSVDLPKKHGRGGQSALRFARLRLEKRQNYVRRSASLFSFSFFFFFFFLPLCPCPALASPALLACFSARLPLLVGLCRAGASLQLPPLALAPPQQAQPLLAARARRPARSADLCPPSLRIPRPSARLLPPHACMRRCGRWRRSR